MVPAISTNTNDEISDLERFVQPDRQRSEEITQYALNRPRDSQTSAAVLTPMFARIASSSTNHRSARNIEGIIVVMTGLWAVASAPSKRRPLHTETPWLSQRASWKPITRTP